MLKRLQKYLILLILSLTLMQQTTNAQRICLHCKDGIYGAYGGYLPFMTIKTNLLQDITANPNLGMEFYLTKNLTLDLSTSYRPFDIDPHKRIRHLTTQPELRIWPLEAFGGHFIGIHLNYSFFNVGFLDMPNDLMYNVFTNPFQFMTDAYNFGNGENVYRNQGHTFGGGVSYGYQWPLGRDWSMEASIGFGYLYQNYDRYITEFEGGYVDTVQKHYFGPTKFGLSVSYLFF